MSPTNSGAGTGLSKLISNAVDCEMRAGPNEPLFRCGEPRADIPAMARILGVDLIVISTHDSGWLRHVVEGSNAEKIMHQAPCPVLIVRAEEDYLVR